MKKFFTFLLLIVLSISFVACKKKVVTTDDATGVTISGAAESMKVGETMTLTATVAPSTAAQAVTWSSSDTAVATVSAGKVTAVAVGSVTITATVRSNTKLSDAKTITVTAAPSADPTGVTLNDSNHVMYVGRTYTLRATVTPSDAAQTVVWTSSSEACATVADGVVTAVAEGTTNITATVPGTAFSATCIISVEVSTTPAPTGLTITADSTTVGTSSSLALTATVAPEGASQDVEWTSSNEEVATVSAKGVVAGIAEGTVTITATSLEDPTISGTYNVTVAYLKPENIEVDCQANVQCNSSITLSFTLNPAGASVGTVAWSVDDDTLATIVTTSKATKLRCIIAEASSAPLGYVTVTVTHTDKDGNVLTAEKQVLITDQAEIVAKAPESIAISGSPNIAVGDATTLLATVLPAGALQSVTWSSSDETVAIVSKTGKVTALKEGTVYIQASSIIANAEGSLVTNTYKITVKAVPDIGTPKNMNGFELNVFQASGAISEVNPRNDLYGSIDKAAKIAAWETVESMWNCKIDVKAYPDSAPWGPLRISWMGKNIQNNLNPTNDAGDRCSIFIGPTDWLPQLSANGAIVDCTEYYNQWGFSSMPSSLSEQATYAGKIYAMPDVTDVAAINLDLLIVYNYALIKKYNLESPAKLYLENKWHYSDFIDYVSTAQAAISVDSTADSPMTVVSGQPCLWYIGMSDAGGCKLADVSQMKMQWGETIPRVAAQTLRTIYTNGSWGDIAWDATVTSFNNQKSIMQSAYWWFVNSSDRFTKEFWGAGTTEYGVVPFPYPDNISNTDAKNNISGQSIFMLAAQPKGYTDDITAEDVYKAWYYACAQTGSNLRGDLSYNYDEKMTSLAEAKLADTSSIECVASVSESDRIFDPIYHLTLNNASIHMSKLAPTLSAIVRDGTDYDEAWATYSNDYDTALQQCYGGTAS